MIITPKVQVVGRALRYYRWKEWRKTKGKQPRAIRIMPNVIESCGFKNRCLILDMAENQK